MTDIIELYHQSEEYFSEGISLETHHIGNSGFCCMTGIQSPNFNALVVRDLRVPLEEQISRAKAIFDQKKLSHIVMLPDRLLLEPVSTQLGHLGWTEVDMIVAMYKPLAPAPEPIDPDIKTTNYDLNTWCKPLIPAFGTTELIGAQSVDARQRALDRGYAFHYFTLFNEGLPVTSITVSLRNNIARIDDLGTYPAYQKRGFAARLFQYALAKAASLGAKHCFLDASASGLALYEKYGFKRLFQYHEFGKESSISERRIMACLKNNYGIKAQELTLLDLGADTDAKVYKALAADTSYFVKLKRGHHHDISVVIHELLHDAGIQQIIPIIKTIPGQLNQRLDDSTLSVFPFIEGQDGFSRDLTADQLLGLGKVMRQVHSLDVPSRIQAMIRREDYSPKWRQAVRALYPLIESEPKGDRVAIDLWTFMKHHSADIHRLVDRADYLAEQVQAQSPPFVLCHSDIHGGNVLIENDGFYIVDWDEPIMAPRERDLMFIGGGVGNVWNKPQEADLFYKGYGPVEVNQAILAYYRHERILEDIAIYAQELLLSPSGGQGRDTLYKHFISQFESRGVVEIAFETDEEFSEGNF
jgi:spectinomycin phosphotransferase